MEPASEKTGHLPQVAATGVLSLIVLLDLSAPCSNTRICFIALGLPIQVLFNAGSATCKRKLPGNTACTMEHRCRTSPRFSKCCCLATRPLSYSEVQLR